MATMSITDRIPYEANGNSGTAMILITALGDGRMLVVCADENEDDDTAVNQSVEHLRQVVCGRHKLNPAAVVWVEYLSESIQTCGQKIGGWELVTFDGAGHPSWRQMTDADWKSLGVDQPPVPVPQRRPLR